MLYTLKHVLGPQQLTQTQELLARARFVDGRLSAGTLAQAVKHNSEMARNDPLLTELNRIVMEPLTRHRQYLRAARPSAIAQPYYVCYESGMQYGAHVDDALMGEPPHRYRSDLAITVFLNEPQAYDGGELVIQHSFGESTVKGNAGDAVLYPATSVHHVNPVTRGKRWVAVTWVQSQVRNHEHRHLLHELEQTLEHLLRKGGDPQDLQRIQYVYANLTREWSEI